MKNKASGLMISIVIAAVSHVLSLLNPIFDPLALGIIIGIIVSNLFEKRERLEAGADLAVKMSLPIGIALYGFRLHFQETVPSNEITNVIAVFAALYLGSILVARLLGLNTNTMILISTGIAVCGASAIAVVSPAIKAKKNETSVAILAVMATGLIYTILYPPLSYILDLSRNEYAFLSGSTMPMVGQVKIAASHYGSDAVTLALGLKSLRIFSLIFMVAIAVAISGLKEKKVTVPWFMVVFVIFIAIANFAEIPEAVGKVISKTSSIFLTLTLSAIGLNTSLDSVSELGVRPFISAFLGLTLVLLILFAVHIAL